MIKHIYMFKFLMAFGFFIFHLSCVLFAQHHETIFKHLTIDDGLSQNSINCIYQDRQGFIWFGTHDGLNRYNGYEFEHFRNDRTNENSLSNNYIYDVYEDRDGILWVATFGGGLNSINPETGKIRRHKMISEEGVKIPDERIFSITEYPDGTLWVGCNGGLIRYDKNTSEARLFMAKMKSETIYYNNYVGIVCLDQPDKVWFQCDSGLAVINTATLQTEVFHESPFGKQFEIGFVFDIKPIADGLLIACKEGLIRLNTRNSTEELILSSDVISQGNPSVSFLSLWVLKEDLYAIGTNQGLIIYDHKQTRITSYQTRTTDPKSLSHNNVLSIHRSKDGVLWLGTRNGINIMESLSPEFIHMRSIGGAGGMSSNNITSFMEMNDSLLWIGTTDGLNLYNRNDRLFSVFRSGNKRIDQLKSDYILCMHKDPSGMQWIGTRGGGLYRVTGNITDISFEQIKPVNDTLYDINVHNILGRENGNIWVGTGGYGLWEYNPANNTIRKYSSTLDENGVNHTHVFNFYEDDHKNLWTGTPSGGLNVLNTPTGKFLYFLNNPKNSNSINNDIILSLHKDSQHQLWVGTNDGLAKLTLPIDQNAYMLLREVDSLQNELLFVNFGQTEGLPNSVIYGMLEDSHGQLWISTNKGLAVFDTHQEKVVKTYDVGDGLQSNEFNQNAFYKDEHGHFYFGGVNGLNVFDPDSITGNKYIPEVLLTGISIFNKPVVIGKPDENGVYLEKAISYLNRINLSWRHQVITLHYAALSYKSPGKNRYRYKLEGFNREWVDAGNSRSATYTRLDPGTYTFRVAASNNSGVWNNSGVSLQIHISTPPWRAWYAWFFYSTITALIIYMFVRFRIRQATQQLRIDAAIEKARETEREAFRKKSAADFHDEAGNKITKLTLFTEMARSEIENKPQLENYLRKIQTNISELSSGMRDFLWVMNPQHDTLFETISRLKDFGDSMLPDTGAKFILKGLNTSLHNITLSMESRRDILQIFKEAMNNCAKYAKAKRVLLSVEMDINTFTVTLSDNGIGFDTTKVRNKNYGIGIMKNRAEKIGGDIAIISKENEGTTISLKCNIPQMGDGI